MSRRILTVNVGSSSVKVALFDADGAELRRGAAADVTVAGTDAVRRALSDLSLEAARPAAVVHRIVHGGADYADPVAVTPAVLNDLRRLRRLAPEHLPPELDAVGVIGGLLPGVPQFACFDTAFHRHMPDVARRYPLPRRFWDAGVQRYGFHGLSCESIVAALERLDPAARSSRVIVAHLGGGSSLTAIQDGRSVDTTMGFSPAGGVMMGSRSGDLDPGVLLHVIREERLDAGALGHLITRESGLKGVSGLGSDMKALLAAEASSSHAAEAIALYCYLARKALGGLMAALGGLDTLVFTGGIGEHASSIRARIVAGLAGLGLEIDSARNDRNDAVISRDEAAATIRVLPSNEDQVLASHALALLSRST